MSSGHCHPSSPYPYLDPEKQKWEHGCYYHKTLLRRHLVDQTPQISYARKCLKMKVQKKHSKFILVQVKLFIIHIEYKT